MAKPHPEESALLKAIASRPDDDLPRVVYADWLDEHGRAERAQFIRLQVEDNRCPKWSREETPRSLAKLLLEEHGRTWFRELPRWSRRWYEERWNSIPSFSRGFIEELDVYLSPFLTFGESLFDRTPLVTLHVHEVKKLRPQLARCRWLGRARHLNLSYETLGVKGAEALAANRHLRGIRQLELAGCELGDEGVRALAEANSLTGLQSLSLAHNNLTLAAVKALRLSPLTRSLHHLDLSDNPRLACHAERIRDWFPGRVRVIHVN